MMVLETEDPNGGDDSPRYQVGVILSPQIPQTKKKIHIFTLYILFVLYFIFIHKIMNYIIISYIM